MKLTTPASINRHPRGVALLWAIIALVGLMAFSALSLDWARVTMAKTQMQQSADAAALAAAAQLKNGTAKARTFAINARNSNPVEDRAVWMASPVFSQWDNVYGQYTVVDIDMERSDAHDGGIPLILGNFSNFRAKTVKAHATARVIREIAVDQQVMGTANPFLAGMPEGSVASLYNPHNSPDYAGDVTSRDPKKWKQSPLPVKGLPLIPGQALTFDNIAGTTRHDPNLSFYEPDGETGENGVPRTIGRNTRGSENGISDINCPINALVGVFLGPDMPTNRNAPPSLDASTPELRGKTSYQPQLQQIFFIGDGLTYKMENGMKVPVRQEFVVPEGATRLYLATWDFYEWNNNAGDRVIEIKRPQKVELVK